MTSIPHIIWKYIHAQTHVSLPINLPSPPSMLKNMNDFSRMNQVYSSCFGEHRPARSAIEVARLPRDVLVEVECIASKL